MNDRYQRQRFELKYRIPAATASAVREFVAAHLALDPFGATQPDRSYAVHSLYLDSPDLALFHATINGDRNRFKLRLRWYQSDPAAPVYFEIKRRVDRCILKRRARVRRDAVPRLIAGDWPHPDDVFAPTEQNLGDLHAFLALACGMDAAPRTRVSYRREAWIDADPSGARVTFDREIRSEPSHNAVFETSSASRAEVFPHEVVLELKFTDRFPAWMAEAVRTFDLVQAGAAKYVDGVVAMGERVVRRATGDEGRIHAPVTYVGLPPLAAPR
ncbi:polyphosphate polymerase domain-containing protein [Opitutales bacterium ASA1]|nr:polyphosphate polymerase domain-containing protein [Opitutales bacterium ASA1]